jgi:hypothetical protein
MVKSRFAISLSVAIQCLFIWAERFTFHRTVDEMAELHSTYERKFMKSLILATLVFATTQVFAAAPSPLKLMEKASHKLMALAGKGMVETAFLTDVTDVIVQKTESGFTLVMSAPSADPGRTNALTMNYDADGGFINASAQFVSPAPQSPIFKPANAADLIDIGSEVIVDHLDANSEFPLIAETTQSLRLIPENGEVHVTITLLDGRIYHVWMDPDANVLRHGF